MSEINISNSIVQEINQPLFNKGANNLFIKRDDLITSIKSGLYVSRNIFWNPLTWEYTEKTFRLEGLEFSLGGGDIDIPNLESYARTHFHILDVGGSDPGIGYEVNNNPQEWVAKSTMRYNSLFSQIITPLPAAKPSAFITKGKVQEFKYSVESL